ncbi:class I SAM-dependent rRNA methyltransferase [Stygiobacter electus]|uniref:Class I SAM-dependent rRNA methyltransferase n=1 Tax=Stygiobacter electus TaxID=3032292 RepID=A0AAE3TDU6_9BACT|nr:class I SAM-dependent rRNA methyltransferase [Stygiobacter electus]MDF1612886.1 class I SAM-dependent rRNA methyltransferase [Stygiobacter electus]
MKKVILKKNEDRRIKKGHLWIFSNEISKTEGDIQNGDLVEVYDSTQNFLAHGFYNANSLIAVRIISTKKEIQIENLLAERLNQAYQLRKTIYTNRNSFRLVFSESDFLPGLIIDKYNNTFVLQVYSFGMEKNIEVIINTLKEKFNAENIFTKHDAYFRKLEGLDDEDKIYLGSKSVELIDDGLIKYKVDFNLSQKTGFFFDQCDNREFFGKFCKDKIVLDCFCNSGGFGLHAINNKANEVTFVDSSSDEIENVKNNFALNNFTTKTKYFVSDVFDFLVNQVSQNQKYDIVNIDPPAFAKSRKSIPTAIKGYEKLNKLAMLITKDDGFLFTSSCSHHINDEDFLSIIKNAAIKANKKIQLLHFNHASMDHPILPFMPETLYLKFAMLKVSSE